MKLLQIILITNLFINSYGYNMLFSICNAAFNTFIEDLKYISVRPISSHNYNSSIILKDISLIIYKGSNIKSENYIGISNTIQKIGLDRGLKIDIKIPHYPYLKNTNINENIKKKPLFAIGHSSGTYQYLLTNNISNYDGLIQIGSVLNSKGKLPWNIQNLEKFPIPVMTLVGNKDGYLRYLYCIDEIYNQTNIDKYVKKPIIVMNNITHLHISNTTSSNIANMLGLKDLKSSITVEEAWEEISSTIIDFIILNLNHTSYNISMENMIKKYNHTNKLLSSYSKFDNIDNLKGFLSILHMSLNDMSYHDIYYHNYIDFISSKPTNNSIHFYKQKKMFSKMYYSPLWIKTKYNIYISAKKINKYLFEKIKNYYNFDTKLKIIFKPDRVCFTTLEWLMTDIKIYRNDNTIYIQCPIFITRNDSFLYKNYYYLKMLSPAQIFELMNIDLQDY